MTMQMLIINFYSWFSTLSLFTLTWLFALFTFIFTLILPCCHGWHVPKPQLIFALYSIQIIFFVHNNLAFQIFEWPFRLGSLKLFLWGPILSNIIHIFLILFGIWILYWSFARLWRNIAATDWVCAIGLLLEGWPFFEG